MSIHTSELHQAIQQAIEAGGDGAAVLAAARAVDPSVAAESVFSLADELADLGVVDVRIAPPADAVGRRELLRSLLAGSAAAAGLAAVAATPRLAQAAEADVCLPSDSDFRSMEKEMKQREDAAIVDAAREEHAKQIERYQEEASKLSPRQAEERVKLQQRSQEETQKRVGRTNEQRRKHAGREQARKQQAARYALSGPGPLWIEVEDAYELVHEVELSSIQASGEGCGTVTMDILVDGLGERVSLKEQVGTLAKLAPVKAGGPSPLLEVTWGEYADEGFEGYLETVAVAYSAFLEDGTPARAVVRATFLVA